MVTPSGPPPSGDSDSARFSGGSFSESEDIYMTINTDHGAEFYGVEQPRVMLTKEPSQNERQISVDPISLQGTATIRQASFRLVSPKKSFGPSNPVPSPPSKLKFVSTSLPSSASSSPSSTSLMKKIWKSQNGKKPVTSRSNLSRMPSTMDDSHLAMIEANQRRSRSLGEGRTSTHMDDLDLWLEKSKKNKHKNNSSNNNDDKNSRGGHQTHTSDVRNYSKPPLGPNGGDRLSNLKSSKSRGEQSYPEDGFKCGKLCLFLPRGKGKTVRSLSTVSTQVSSHADLPTISRTVSLERFECGSWGSSLHEDAEGDSTNLFFDLPMEMIRCSVSDMQSAVTAAFVFENENNAKKDQEDFNAFLEAQG